MTRRSLRRISLGALAGLALVAGTGAAEAQERRVTLRALYSNVPNLSGATSEAVPDVFALDVKAKNPWYALDLDIRASLTLSLNVTSSRGKLAEALTLFPPQEPAVLVKQTSTIRHDVLSLLFHPVPGHFVDFYFGPSYGRATYDRAFTSSESESTVGGKVGADLQLGWTGWIASAQLSVLTSGWRIADGEPRRNIRYTVVGAGLGYRF
jgi:hypothetical protein